MITLTCDNCDKPFQVEDDAQPGEKVSCPYCGDIKVMPQGHTAHAVPVATAARGKPLADTPAVAAPNRAVSKQAEAEDEHEVLVVRQAMFRAHPFWFSLMILIILGGLALAGFAKFKQLNPAYVWLGLAASALGLLWWLGWWGAPHRWVKLVITNKRTIRQEGIVVRKTSEVLHMHIRNVQIKQTVLQRVFGVGSIAIDSAGATDAQHMVEIEMSNVAKPYDVKAVIDQYRGM